MLAFLASFVSCLYVLEHEEKSFLAWMRNTNQIYYGDEYHLRFGIFLSSSRYVQEHNKQNRRFKVSLNKFAAYTPSEYRALLGFRMDRSKKYTQKSTRKSNVDSLDWRDKGVINPIKDQGGCASCWAFSAVASVEAIDAIATGTLQSFSEQNLVDCVTGCQRCVGGLMTAAYDYIIQFQDGKFCLEDDYKYTAVGGICLFDQYSHVGSITKYVNIEEGNEDDLAAKVEQYGPVAVAIDSGCASFQLYNSGIYDDPDCSTSYVNHGVNCIGFGLEDGTKYWIVRNEWGLAWGEKGYFRMLWDNNQCGIATCATLPFP